MLITDWLAIIGFILFAIGVRNEIKKERR